MNKKIVLIWLLLTLIISSCTNNDIIKLNESDSNIIGSKNSSNVESMNLEKVNLNIKTVSLKVFKSELSNNNLILIDLRTNEEVAQWVISWAKQIDFYWKEFKDELDNLDKNKKYLIYCRSWSRSAKTLKLMKELWFKNVLNLEWWINWWLLEWYKIVPITKEKLISNTQEITINAKNWEFDKTEIRVKKWTDLTIKINNVDRHHWIAIRDMKLVWAKEIKPDTSKVWEYEYICATYCGEWHDDMSWILIIEE